MSNWLDLQSVMLGKFLCACLMLFVLYQDVSTSNVTPLICSNGGTSYVDKNSTAKCLCTAGYIAPTCIDRDPCNPSPCKNHGTCTFSGTGNRARATCHCLPGFTGSNCEHEIPACDTSPCERGACLNNASSYHCVCPPAYTGQDCQTYIGYCGTGSSSCSGKDAGAVCTDADQGYTCACSNDNRYGFNCESNALSLPPGGCGDIGVPESYCVCSANGETVKVPLERPLTRSKGVKPRDFIVGLLGLLLGWGLGSALLTLYYCCCKNSVVAGATAVASVAKVEPLRPNTASSMQSESTILSNYMHPDSKTMEQPQTPVIGSTPVPSATLNGPLTPSAESMTEPSKDTNIYRATFVDDMAHKVSHRKSPLTYTSASKDW
ncbi:hypothetical protein RRG08_033560 [Elysia crispata]|uniref:EGF-like domain-containing protein n=1 Tax=Elysia crispata TaxID=231223 RepID=A0AAE1CJE3_9GAST|nr:hypothetical protein RRG08_033560 [Elysia crispata]